MTEDVMTPGVEEELGFSPAASNSSYQIEGGKKCGHDGCDWETPRDMVQNFHKSRAEALMKHLKEEHGGKFPFETEVE